MYKVLMFGDRDWSDAGKIRKELYELINAHGRGRLLIISGKARGADSISAREAKKQGVHVAEVQALWDHYKRAAGPIRNGVMKALDPQEGIGFHADIENSKGTKNMRDQLLAAKIPVRIVE